MHFIVPKIINIGRILNLGKCFIITALFFLILHKGINYQQYGTIPPTSDRLISSTASTLKHTGPFLMQVFWTQPNFSNLSVPFLHIENQHVGESPFILSLNTIIKDKTVADIVNTTMNRLKSKYTARESFVRTLIVTSWRSGSTLMGELLNSIPDSFYSYEPLALFEINRIYNDSNLVSTAVNVIKSILKCNYSMVNYEYKRNKFSYSEIAQGELITRNNFLKPFCKERKQRSLICSRADFLDNMCALSHYHVMKTVRLGLDVASSLLNDTEVNHGLKLVYIARDPRALVNSRLHREWCVENDRCIGYSNICKDLERDYWSAKWLQAYYKEQIKIIRYEDFSLDIWNQSLELLQFTGREMTSEVKTFLFHHTSKTEFEARPEVWNTFHDPQEAPVHWIKELSWETIKAIQIECKTAMTLWGYKIMNSKHDVDTILAKTL